MATETDSARAGGRGETDGGDPRAARAKVSDLDVVRHHFDRAWDSLGYPDDIRQIFWEPYREVTVQIPIKAADGTTRVYHGYRIQHNGARGPYKGGVRFHPEVCLEECEALAMMMTWKCSLSGIPYGGGKGGVCCEPLELSRKEKERICRTWAARMEPVVGAMTDVPAPDVNTGGPEMVWFMDTISKMRNRLEPAIFTGKPIPLWGSKGRTAATGYGVATCAIGLTGGSGADR